MSIRAVARLVDRDVKAVHGDVQALLLAGVLDRDVNGQVVFPYDAIHVDFTIEGGVTVGDAASAPWASLPRTSSNSRDLQRALSERDGDRGRVFGSVNEKSGWLLPLI